MERRWSPVLDKSIFGAKGAIGAVLAREVPFGEMTVLAPQLTIPAEVLVYGATCIHQSKRPLLQNYYNYTQQEDEKSRERGLFYQNPRRRIPTTRFMKTVMAHIFSPIMTSI